MQNVRKQLFTVDLFQFSKPGLYPEITPVINDVAVVSDRAVKHKMNQQIPLRKDADQKQTRAVMGSLLNPTFLHFL